MKKGVAIAVNNIMGLILIVAVGLVLLQATGLWKTIFGVWSEDKVCEASFVASSMSKVFSLGTGSIDPDCRTKRITVTLEEEGDTEEGSQLMSLDRNYMTTFPEADMDTYTRVTEWFPDNYNVEFSYIDEDNDYVRRRYNMDMIMANELKRCWDIVGQGELPLFSNLFQFFGCGTGEQFEECDDAKEFFETWHGDFHANFCVLCSRIKFEEDVNNQFDGEMDSIFEWMASHPKRIADDESYYDYVWDERVEKSMFVRPDYAYSVDEPQAVVFTRINFHAGAIGASAARNWLNDMVDRLPVVEGSEQSGEPIYYYNTLQVIPYSDMQNQCDYVVGSFI